jgi:hypothetical protein
MKEWNDGIVMELSYRTERERERERERENVSGSDPYNFRICL